MMQVQARAYMFGNQRYRGLKWSGLTAKPFSRALSQFAVWIWHSKGRHSARPDATVQEMISRAVVQLGPGPEECYLAVKQQHLD